MKKIAMVHTNIDPKVIKESSSLAKKGYDVTVFVWKRKEQNLQEIEGVKIESIKIKSNYGISLENYLKMHLFLVVVFFKSLRYDIIHTHDFPTALLGVIMRFLGKKWIYDVHDLYFTYFSIGEKIVKRIDLFFVKVCDKLIVPTESIGGRYEGIKEFYTDNGISKKKITTIWNVPTDEFLDYKELNLRRSERFTIGFIGAQRSIHTFIVLFEAIKRLENYKILFVGEGKDTKKLKKIVKEKYSNLDIEFIGSIEYRKIPNYYKLCDAIYKVPQIDEDKKRAIPIKTFEASTLGIPLLTLRGTLNEDFINRYKCGVVIDNLDVPSVIQGIKKIKAIKFDNKKIMKDWNWKTEEKKLLNLYGRV